MSRYFLELAYRGTNYKGFQVQENAPTIQGEVEKAISVLHKEGISLTGSSRTDAGVHALQNYFHFDYAYDLHKDFVYKLNAILPPDVVIKNLYAVKEESHARFDALSREYKYVLYSYKNPFLTDRAYFFPYPVDTGKLNEAAELLTGYEDFTSFSKRNTQVKTFICKLEKSEWTREDGCLVYRVKGNRFLRGMVRAMVATMLQAGRQKISLDMFREVIESRDCTRASFSVPARGLYLTAVNYPEGYFEK